MTGANLPDSRLFGRGGETERRERFACMIPPGGRGPLLAVFASVMLLVTAEDATPTLAPTTANISFAVVDTGVFVDLIGCGYYASVHEEVDDAMEAILLTALADMSVVEVLNIRICAYSRWVPFTMKIDLVAAGYSGVGSCVDCWLRPDDEGVLQNIETETEDDYEEVLLSGIMDVLLDEYGTTVPALAPASVDTNRTVDYLDDNTDFDTVESIDRTAWRNANQPSPVPTPARAAPALTRAPTVRPTQWVVEQQEHDYPHFMIFVCIGLVGVLIGTLGMSLITRVFGRKEIEDDIGLRPRPEQDDGGVPNAQIELARNDLMPLAEVQFVSIVPSDNELPPALLSQHTDAVVQMMDQAMSYATTGAPHVQPDPNAVPAGEEPCGATGDYTGVVMPPSRVATPEAPSPRAPSARVHPGPVNATSEGPPSTSR